MAPMAGTHDHLVGLNAAQRAAATHGAGPLLVIAGAGTGKTRTLVARVAHLVSQGVPAERILLLTFTRRAAREMLERAARLVDSRLAGRVWGGTFHAVANRLLRMHAPTLGLDPAFTVIDQADAADVMNLVRSELGLAEKGRRFPAKGTLADVYTHTVNAGRPLPLVVEERFPWCRDDLDGIRAVFEGYMERKRSQDLLDFDDLLLHWRAAAESPGLGERLGAMFDHVLVDEYQDTNDLQAAIVRATRAACANVTAVGDDAQAIYSFRAATARNILEFPAQFPGTTLVTLEQSYRATGPLLAVANGVIARARERFTKELWSERHGEARPDLVTCADEIRQADAVCEAVLSHLDAGRLLRSQAVLFRAGHHSDLLEVELGRRNIPFVKYGGLRFLEAAHVKDVLACLRVLENPYDEPAWFRLLRLLEGVGPATARRLVEVAGVRPRLGDPGPLGRLDDVVAGAPADSQTELAGLAAALGDCAGAPGPPAGRQVERLAAALAPIVRRRYDGAEARLRDLDQVAHFASGHASRARLLTELTLDPPAVTGDLAGPPLLDEDYLVLSTVHSAKGCEWDVVHVIHAADGMFPSDMATGDPEGVEEERRLFYVALTRARDSLHVYFPLRYFHRRRGLGDGHNWAQLTRFLPPDVQALCERRSAGVEAETGSDASGDVRGAGGPGRIPAAAAVDEALRSLWA